MKRRRGQRHSMDRDVLYRVLGHDHPECPRRGTTLNISDFGLLFTTEYAIKPGSKVEVTIGCGEHSIWDRKVVARGRVVRSEQGRTAVDFEAYTISEATEAPEGTAEFTDSTRLQALLRRQPVPSLDPAGDGRLQSVQ